MRQSELLLVLDRHRADLKHQAGHCCHDLTWPELLDEMGVDYEVVDRPERLPEKLPGAKVVILAELDGSAQAAELEDWVRAGGMLLGFMTEGLDALFGVRCFGRREQPDDEFTINAYVKFLEKGWMPEGRRYTVPVISPVRIVRATEGRAVAQCLYPQSFNLYADTTQPGADYSDAVVSRPLGSGETCYFSSSFAQTVRILHQGRPVDRDWDGDGMYRTADGIVLTSAHDLQDPLADDHLWRRRRCFERAGLVSCHVFPPMDGGMTDCVFYYRGDDECDPTGVQQVAIEKMHDYGLPYHINIMWNDTHDGYAMSRELVEHMMEYGQEPSIHFNFLRSGGRYTRAELDEQVDLFEKTFGITPKIQVPHCVMFWGWTETARWCAERGILGDNGKFPARLMPDPNPINTFGFPFGTSYPVYVYDDALHGDVRLNYLSIPAIYYEPRVYEETRERDLKVLEEHIEQSVANAWMLPMFFHPVYVAQDEAANSAILAELDIVKRRGYRVLHLGPDALAVWWGERCASTVRRASEHTFDVDVRAERGVILRLPEPLKEPKCRLDDREVVPERRVIAGCPAWYLPVEKGTHVLEWE